MKKTLLWILAVIITLCAVYYQRITGPTYPKRITVEMNKKQYKLKLIRSAENQADAPVELKMDSDVEATLYYKLYPSKQSDEWSPVSFKREGEKLVALLPNQPAAGKLMYYINLKTPAESIDVEKNNPVIIRFKGEVPGIILLPHILLMFVGMLLANVTGLFAIWKINSYKFYTYLTLALIAIGGMILGPLVQYKAFGELWTGIPFGWDLTDNKTLIAFLFWIIAVIGQIKQERPYLTIIASVITLVIYLIPHSMFGSELDRETGTVTQGIIQLSGIINSIL